MTETNQKIYCTRCGQEHESTDQYCGNCGYFLHDKDHLFRAYLISHTKDKLQGDVEDKIFEIIKNFLLSHLYGMVMTVTLAAALVTAVAAHPAPRAQKADARPSSVSEVLMAGEAPAATPVPTPTPEPAPADEGYYDYLRDTLLPQLGMATTEEVHIPFNGNAIWQANGAQVSGVIGADVRDYDGDGVRDLLVLNLTVRPMGETALGRLMYETDKTCLAVEMQLYTCKDGAVALSDTVAAVTEMESASWGPMNISVLEIDGVPYILGQSVMEDISTYGARPAALYHVENGKFVFDWMGGRIGWGQGSYQGDVNAAAGAAGNALTLEQNQRFTGSVEAIRQNEADGSVAYLDEDFSMLSTIGMEYVGDAIVYRARDYTQLAEILERGEEAVKAERTPAPSPTPAPEHGGAEAETQAIADAIQSAVGISLKKTRESMDDVQYVVGYTAPDGSEISMTYRLDTGNLRTIGVYAQGSTVTQEWIALKDAALDLESLGFDADKTAKFHGDCGFRYASPEDVGGGATIVVANAGTCVMLAQWTD